MSPMHFVEVVLILQKSELNAGRMSLVIQWASKPQSVGVPAVVVMRRCEAPLSCGGVPQHA